MNPARIIAGSALRRAMSVLVVLFVVFQPAVAFAIQLLKAESVMSCCRTKRSCCCRKDGKRSQAPAWKAGAVDCERSCSPATVTVKPIAFVHSNWVSARGMLPVADGVLLPTAPTASQAYLAFLHQRPPPFTS